MNVSSISLRNVLKSLSGSNIPFEEVLPGDIKINKKILDNLSVNEKSVKAILDGFAKDHLEAEDPVAMYAALVYLFLRMHTGLYKVINRKVTNEPHGKVSA